MEIAYVVKPRPDTGLWNAKVAIWLFLASEVMLFGALFSAYVFLRIGALPGMWPRGLMDVPVGTFNTIILILSSITAVFAWAAVKMRQFTKFRIYLGTTILLGIAFLCIKLGYEYPAKFEHFGAYIKQDSLAKYEPYLGNKYLAAKGLPPRYEISGHLKGMTIDRSDSDPAVLDATVSKFGLISTINGNLETIKLPPSAESSDKCFTLPEYSALEHTPGAITNPEEKDPGKILRKTDGYVPVSYTIAVDPVNAEPTNPYNDRPHFIHREPTDTPVTVQAADVDFASMFTPNHSTFLGIYYLITVIHALHIVGGLIVFTFFFFPGAKLYRVDPEHFSNRIEVACIYWHFVDLVWIFAFPIFYLL